MEDDLRFATLPFGGSSAAYGNFAVSSGDHAPSAVAAVSGWCSACGRKLAFDGRCERCDSWWASPMCTVGAPLLLATVVLVAVLIGALRGPEPDIASLAPNAAVAPGTPVLMANPPVFRPVVISAPWNAPASASSSIAAAASRPLLPRTSPELAAAWQPSSLSAAEVEIERLRALTRLVDATNAAAAPDAAPAPPLPDGPTDAGLPQARQAATEPVSTL